MDRWLVKLPSSSAPKPECAPIEIREDLPQVVDESMPSCSQPIIDCDAPASSSGSTGKKRKRASLFREEWKEQYTWLVPENSKQGKKCQVCNVPIGGSKTHLERHEVSEAHTKMVNAAKTSIKIQNFIKPDLDVGIVSDAAKSLEVRLCLFVAEHNLPFASVNHLVSCLKEDITDSKIIKKVKLNRIKAQKIVTSLTGPENTNNLTTITNKQYFSLVIDESTDKTMNKNLAIILRIFDTKCRDRFLMLAPLTDCSAQGIYETITNAFDKHKIPFKNLIAFTADNCSVMLGKHNGVQAKLKENVPKLLVNGCICHSLNLMSIAAASKLPSTIDRLIRNINHHFCNSPSRKTDFVNFQVEFGADLHVILKYAATRWLSREAAINRIIEQWTPLTFYFGLTDFENGYGNENISFIEESLKDKTMKMYFLFLSYILKIINGLNEEMQSEEPRMHTYLPRIKYLFSAISRNFIKKSVLESESPNSINLKLDDNQIPTGQVYCGSGIAIFLEKENIPENEILKFKSYVKSFYLTFCEELIKRIDFNNEIFIYLVKFSPEHVLSGETNNILPLIFKLFPDSELINAEKINEEYRALADYEELIRFKNSSISEFWCQIGKIKNSLNEFMFSNIFRIAQGILSIPHSSANVERVFSVHNLIKTKLRNRLATGTCSALLQTRDLIKSTGSCCHSFKITKNIINKNITNVSMTEEELLE